MHVNVNADTFGLVIMLVSILTSMLCGYLLGRRDGDTLGQHRNASSAMPEAECEGYAQVEIVGHQYAEGEVREVTMAGRRMLEIAVEYDEPCQSVPFDPPQVEYLSPAAVFRLTPRDRDECAEERGYAGLPASERGGDYEPPSSEEPLSGQDYDDRVTPTTITKFAPDALPASGEGINDDDQAGTSVFERPAPPSGAQAKR